MAWFDVLGGIGQGLQQGAANFQQLLAAQQERADRLARETEERRRWESTNALAQSAERRASAAETRAAEKDTRAQALELLPLFQGQETVSPEDVKAIAEINPGVAKLLFSKNADGTFTARKSLQDEKSLLDVVAARQTSQAKTTYAELMDNPAKLANMTVRQRVQLAERAGYSPESLLNPDETQAWALAQLNARFGAGEKAKDRALQERLTLMELAGRGSLTPLQQLQLKTEYEQNYLAFEKNELTKMYGYDPRLMAEDYKDENALVRLQNQIAGIRAQYERQQPPAQYGARSWFNGPPPSDSGSVTPRKDGANNLSPASRKTPPLVNWPHNVSP